MTQELRVLYLIDSLAASGAETSLLQMVGPLRRHHVDVHVGYFGRDDSLARAMRDDGATVWDPRNPSGKRSDNVRFARRLIDHVRPTLVHTTLFEADIAGRIAARSKGVPIVSSIVNDMYGQEQRALVPSALRLRLAQLTDVMTSRFVRQFHAISSDVADRMAPKLRIERSRIAVIPRGRSFAELGSRTPERRSSVRRRLDLPQDAPVLLVAAREEPQKDIVTAVEGFVRISTTRSDARLVIAGRRGSDSARIDAAIERSGLRDRIHRLGQRSDVADLMAAADLLVAPSLWEGLGGVLIEAMALECRIVCSELPVFREVTDGTHAVYFAPGDSAALADSCRAALDSMAPKSLQSARDFAFNRYDIDSVVDQFGTMYGHVISR